MARTITGSRSSNAIGEREATTVPTGVARAVRALAAGGTDPHRKRRRRPTAISPVIRVELETAPATPPIISGIGRATIRADSRASCSELLTRRPAARRAFLCPGPRGPDSNRHPSDGQSGALPVELPRGRASRCTASARRAQDGQSGRPDCSGHGDQSLGPVGLSPDPQLAVRWRRDRNLLCGVRLGSDHGSASERRVA
jgi:hypothetical protein